MKFCLCFLLLCALITLSFQARCRNDQFPCITGECIALAYRCDGHRDCPDGDDESACQHAGGLVARLGSTPSWDDVRCTSAEFDCGRGGAGRYGRCIPYSWSYMCNGVNDCANGADESNCLSRAARGCQVGELRCSSGQCLPPEWVCDGRRDCSDGADESNCPVRTVASPPTTPRRPATRQRQTSIRAHVTFFVGLANTTPQPLVQTSSGTAIHITPHFINGLDVEIMHLDMEWQRRDIPRKEDCARLCTHDSDCKFASYHKTYRLCSALGENPYNLQIKVDENTILYSPVTTTATRYAAATLEGTEVANRGSFGPFPIVNRLQLAWTEQMCIDVCLIEPRCHVAIFNTKTNKCQLKQQSRIAPPVASPDHVSIQVKEPVSQN